MRIGPTGRRFFLVNPRYSSLIGWYMCSFLYVVVVPIRSTVTLPKIPSKPLTCSHTTGHLRSRMLLPRHPSRTLCRRRGHRGVENDSGWVHHKGFSRSSDSDCQGCCAGKRTKQLAVFLFFFLRSFFGKMLIRNPVLPFLFAWFAKKKKAPNGRIRSGRREGRPDDPCGVLCGEHFSEVFFEVLGE